MTVIEVSLNRQRPGLVRKEFDSPRVQQTKKRKSAEGDLMQQIQGCAFGDFLPGNVPAVEKELLSERQVEGKLLRGEGGAMSVSAIGSKKPKISSRIDLPQVRGRRKSRWKLKFHHQALPPEYLRHYKQQERKRRQTETRKSNLFKSKIRKIVKKAVSDVDVKKEGDRIDEDGAERLTTIAETLPAEEEKPGDAVEETGKSPQDLLQSNISQLNIDISQNKAFLENLLTNQIEINRVESVRKEAKSIKREDKPKMQPVTSTGKIMNFSDLPYMGEITLDGIKPRRGRKPKKADICHLIYKNYGQVFPGSPGRSTESGSVKKQQQQQQQSKWKSEVSNGWNQMNSSQSAKVNVSDRGLESPLPSVSGLINHTEVQNRIINSLLEKRLTQERKCKSVGDDPISENTEEPLNLCIRDLQSLKIKLSRKHGNIYETKNSGDAKTGAEDGIKKEVISVENSESDRCVSSEDEDEEDDLAPFNLVTTELRESSDEDNFLNFNDQITLTKIKPGEEKVQKLGETDPGLFWPGMTSPLLYYQRLGSEDKSNVLRSVKDQRRKLDGERMQNKRIASKGNATHVITKRKRSAIFIPPVPAENTTNPTTEVSICKFKFTGGAKPSLQEKKMLSVDSGGNFRYYSGTGDKSMRGYEYFPRESLQQCQENTGCSPSGVFLTASALGSGEKIPEEIGHSGFFGSDFPVQVPPPKSIESKPRTKHKLTKKSDERYQTLREHLTGEKSSDVSEVVLFPEEEVNSSDDSTDGFEMNAMMQQNYFDGFKGHGNEIGRSKKSRKTRKSLAREKLEQTFKEKGFLIQTQQLESAEGATYCKFRQLRKFTRYLFRSWKDYLPGNVRDLSVDAGVDDAKILELPETAIKSDSSDPNVKFV